MRSDTRTRQQPRAHMQSVGCDLLAACHVGHARYSSMLIVVDLPAPATTSQYKRARLLGAHATRRALTDHCGRSRAVEIDAVDRRELVERRAQVPQPARPTRPYCRAQ